MATASDQYKAINQSRRSKEMARWMLGKVIEKAEGMHGGEWRDVAMLSGLKHDDPPSETTQKMTLERLRRAMAFVMEEK